MNKYVGETIYVKSETDVIKKLISAKKSEYYSSHNKFYGNPNTKEKLKPILNSERRDHNKIQRRASF